MNDRHWFVKASTYKFLPQNLYPAGSGGGALILLGYQKASRGWMGS